MNNKLYKLNNLYKNMRDKETKSTVEVFRSTARMIQMTKHLLGYKNADETINKVFEIAKRIRMADKC